MDKEPVVGTLRRLEIPLALIVLAFFIMAAFQTMQLYREYVRLGETRTAQEATMQEATKLRQQLESLASKTAHLAEAGNANAKVIIDELKRQGITVKANP